MSSLSWLWGLAIVLAVVLIVTCSRLGAVRAGLWAASAVLGQAAVLQLIRAGPLVGYQHYVGLAEARANRLFSVAVTLAMIGIAVAGVVARRGAAIAWLRSRPRIWTIIAALVIGSLVAAAPSASASQYATELVAGAVIQFAALACVVLAASELPENHVARFHRWLSGHEEQPAKLAEPDRWPWALAAFVVLVSTILCLTSYQAIPHIPDEIVYLIQARYLAAGLPWMTPPSVPAAFDTFLLEISGDRWYGVFPPGWPLVLAIGVRLGVPFLVNPVLGGICVVLTYYFVRELSDRATARISALLLALSPWHLLMSMSFMSHVLSLALALVTALGVARACRTGRWGPALMAGLSLGVLGMSRPLEGVAIGLLAGVPLLVVAVRRSRPGMVIGAGAGTLATGLLGLAYNAVITGSPWVFPAERLFDREFGPGRYSLGFGPEKGLGWTGLDPFPGHGAVDVVVNSVLNAFMINIDLFGWAAGSVAIVALGFLGARKGIDRLMAVTIGVVIVLHSAFWFSGGPDIGARYWYLILVPCVVLAARVLGATDPGDASIPGGRAAAAAVFLSVSALCLYVPWRAVDKYRHYRGVRADLMTLRNDATYRNGLVLVSGNRHPDWASAAIANDVAIGATPAPVFAWDRDAETRRRILDAFPDRPVWLVRGPSETGRGFEVIRGPVAPNGRASLKLP